MKKWQENVLGLDESLRDIIDEINNGCLVYSEVESVMGKYRVWEDYNGKRICLIDYAYGVNFYRYDDNGNCIYDARFNSINKTCCRGYTSISLYDTMNNKINSKFISSIGHIYETRDFYNENNKMIKHQSIDFYFNTNICDFYDENGKFVHTTHIPSNKKASKYLALLNKNKNGYKKYSFFGHDVGIFKKYLDIIYPKYKIKDIKKKD